jgi:hypothetical protein
VLCFIFSGKMTTVITTREREIKLLALHCTLGLFLLYNRAIATIHSDAADVAEVAVLSAVVADTISEVLGDQPTDAGYYQQ